MESAVTTVRTVLASRSDQDERSALSTLADLVARDGASQRAWWTSLGGEPLLTDELLVYVFARAFAPPALLAAVFKSDALTTATAIPALCRKADSALEIHTKLLKRLTRVVWPAETLQRLSAIISHIEDPRVRQQTIQFGYSVLAHWCTHPNASEQWVQEAIRVLLLGVTDVWSAVRKESARAAVAITFQFPTLNQIDAFAIVLLKIASGDDWKAQEGALLTLTAIMASIQVETVASSSAAVKPAATARTADLIKGGSASPAVTVVYHLGRHRGLGQLLRSLTIKLKPALYAALKHSQLSVREAAALCFVRFMEICDEATRVLSFQEVMSKLNRLTPETALPSELTPATLHPDEGADQNVELLDAAEAEGLLDVLAKLVPHLPVTFLVKHWKFVSPTLERYVVHIASTVRLRSSAVVLALAELSLVEIPSASIELLYRMLLALAEGRPDIGVCWQRLEGRLLSVDLLVGFLGRDRLWRLGTRQTLLHFVSRPRASRAPRAADAWLPDAMVAQATWTLDEEEEQRFQRASLSTASIIERLNALAQAKAVASSEMWQSILRGWLRQTRAAFDSTQFELRRIARQVLPRLVRLCVWCDQLPLVHEPHTSAVADVKSTTLSGSGRVDAWLWSCLRHAVLHAQLLRESGDTSTDTQRVLGTCSEFVAETIRTARLRAATGHDEPDAVVARVEVILLANVSDQKGSIDSNAVSCALRDVHATIPASYQPSLATGVNPCQSRDGGSLDRQFSIALVPLLPVIVVRLVATQGDLLLWRIVERVTLSWLATDDMFRWITIDKLTAQMALLRTLQELLTCPEADSNITLSASGGDEVASIVRTLESAIPISKPPLPHKRLMDLLVPIYASLWRFVAASTSNAKVQGKIITSLALLHDHKNSSAVAPVKLDATKSDWDDWDGDGASGTPVDAGAKHQELRPTISLEDPSADDALVASIVNTALSSDQVDALASALQRLLASHQPMAVHHQDALQSFFSSMQSRCQQLST